MRLARSYSRRRRPHRDRRQRSSIRNRQALTREHDSKENRMGLQIVGAVIGALKKVSEWFGVRYSPPCITARRGWLHPLIKRRVASSAGADGVVFLSFSIGKPPR